LHAVTGSSPDASELPDPESPEDEPADEAATSTYGPWKDKDIADDTGKGKGGGKKGDKGKSKGQYSKTGLCI